MEKVKVRVINISNQSLPEYATERSAGMDVRAYLAEMDRYNRDVDGVYVTLEPGQTKMIKTGIFMEIPEGYEVQVRPRSGLALKHGITVLNSPGTIDSDYRGECNVILHNTKNTPYKIYEGDRIAQFILSKVEQVEWKNVSEIEDTDRGSGGFGSTGK